MKLAILVFMDLEVVFVCANCNIIDLDNTSRTGLVSSTKKYYHSYLLSIELDYYLY